MVHVNFVIGNRAKIYRMRELGFYRNNVENYYHNESKRFIMMTLHHEDISSKFYFSLVYYRKKLL